MNLLQLDGLPNWLQAEMHKHAGSLAVIQGGRIANLNDLENDVYGSKIGLLSPAHMAALVQANPAEGPYKIPSADEWATHKRNRDEEAAQANPWAKSTYNLTEQMRIIKANPRLADRLKAKAG